MNDKSRTVTVKRPAAGSDAATVTLKATAKYDTATETKTFTVTIQPIPAAEEKDEAYVWAFFPARAWAARKSSLAASKGNDAWLEHAEQWHSAAHFKSLARRVCAIRSS